MIPPGGSDRNDCDRDSIGASLDVVKPDDGFRLQWRNLAMGIRRWRRKFSHRASVVFPGRASTAGMHDGPSPRLNQRQKTSRLESVKNSFIMGQRACTTIRLRPVERWLPALGVGCGLTVGGGSFAPLWHGAAPGRDDVLPAERPAQRGDQCGHQNIFNSRKFRQQIMKLKNLKLKSTT